MDHDNNRIKRLLDEQDWDSLSRYLVAAIVALGRRYKWHSGGINQFGEGNTPEDIAHRVIQKVYAGTRTWDPDQVDLKTWLVKTARSELTNLFTKKGHSQEFSIIPIGDDVDEEAIENKYEHQAVDGGVFSHEQSLSPEDILVSKEKVLEMETALDAAIQGDPALEQLYEAIIESHDVNYDELSRIMGKPVAEIYTLMKKLRRRLKGIYTNE